MKKQKIKKEKRIFSQYRLSWKYLKELKSLIFLVIILFIISGLIGFFYPEFFKENIIKFLSELSSQIENLDFSGLLFFILQNNIKASFFGLIFGLIIGIIPIVNVITNGYVLGFVSNLAVQENGYLSLLQIVPHGIFELPALALSLACGLKIGLWFNEKNKKKYIQENIKNSLRVFLLIVLPLLILAGIIEAGLIILLG